MTEEEQKEFLNELNSFGYEFKKVFSNRRKNNDLSDRVKKKNCCQNMTK